MERFLIYLLQAALTLTLLHGIHRLFIHRETFHRLNRWALLGSLALSALLPAVSIPAIERETAGIVGGISSLLLPVVVSPEGSAAAVESAQAAQGPDIWQVAGWAYVGVCAILMLRLLVQLAGISRLIASSERLAQGNFCLVVSKRIHAPFSFFRYIFINPEDLGGNNTGEILDHEEVHARQLHSIDNLFSELYALVFWFNPVSWWHKKEIMLNLEYLADKGALQKGCEPETYQLQLLKASLRDNRYALANHFAQSIIKRRIKMMNTEHSPLKRAWKYLLLLPAAAAALFLLNCSSEINNEPRAEEQGLPNASLDEVVADPDTSQNGAAYKFASVDKKPVFPGGNDKIMGFIIDHITYPAAAKDAKIQGTVYVQFTIDKDGTLRDIKAVRGQELGGGLAQEAARVVGEMPAWTPGEHQGQKVMVSYTLPIFFKLGDEASDKRTENPPGVHSFADVDQKPQFPGGNDKIMDYVANNFVFPAEALNNNIQGTVFIQFVIEKDGSINDVRCVRGEDLGGGLADEAIRVVKSMPTWTPGEHQGQKIAVSYTLPIFARQSK